MLAFVGMKVEDPSAGSVNGSTLYDWNGVVFGPVMAGTAIHLPSIRPVLPGPYRPHQIIITWTNTIPEVLPGIAGIQPSCSVPVPKSPSA